MFRSVSLERRARKEHVGHILIFLGETASHAGVIDYFGGRFLSRAARLIRLFEIYKRRSAVRSMDSNQARGCTSTMCNLSQTAHRIFCMQNLNDRRQT
jgi:hypothetical protein